MVTDSRRLQRLHGSIWETGAPSAVYTRLGFVIIYYLTFNISRLIWLMRSFFKNTPRSLEEGAWIPRSHFCIATFRHIRGSFLP